jgi:hypothetical protein
MQARRKLFSSATMMTPRSSSRISMLPTALPFLSCNSTILLGACLLACPEFWRDSFGADAVTLLKMTHAPANKRRLRFTVTNGVGNCGGLLSWIGTGSSIVVQNLGKAVRQLSGCGA